VEDQIDSFLSTLPIVPGKSFPAYHKDRKTPEKQAMLDKRRFNNSDLIDRF